MSRYDELFEETAAEESVFAEKSALDPLAAPEEVVAREAQERQLATLLHGVHEGYLPTTVSIYGPPGTGKTLTTRRLCSEFAERTPTFGVEYVNLKECRTLFSAANEICFELSGEKKGVYEGLDGVFEAIWTALENYPEWTVLILDEIDHVRHDANYDASEFFYRLLRGEGNLKRGLNLSVFLVSNELLEFDLRLDGRVQSAMSGEEVFFPPYGRTELEAILQPRIERAFTEGSLPEDVFDFGVTQAARMWGDARKALTLFRRAGETANERGLAEVTRECLEANLEPTEREVVIEKLLTLPLNHFLVLEGIVGWTERHSGEIIQPVTTSKVQEFVDRPPAALRLSDRAIRDLVAALETMGLVETWIESRGREGRVKQIATTFDPQWVRDAKQAHIKSVDPEIRDAFLEKE